MLINKFLKYALFFVFLSIFAGCARILSPQKGPNTFDTEPTAADVYDGNNIKLGTTPIDLNLIPQKTKLLKVKKEGYQEAEMNVRIEYKNEILFVDAMLLCIPCILDINSNNIYSFSPENATLRLRKELKERNASIKIAIDKVYLEKKDGLLGKINSHFVHLNDKLLTRTFGDLDEQDEIIKSVLNKSFFDVSYFSNVANIKSAMDKPKILIRPVVTDISFELKGKQLIDYRGIEKISINWDIYRLAEKSVKLGTFNTQTQLNRNSGSTTNILDQLILESSRDLLENDSIFDYLQNIEKDYMSSTKGAEIRINVLPAPKYPTIKEALKNAKPAVVTIINKNSFGSGFIISSDGYILTNYHVIMDEKNVTVKLNNDLKVKASLVKSNKEYDLALLHIDAEDLKTVPIGNSDLVESGDEVYAIGTPLEESLGQTITRGIISGERVIAGIKFLQTDVSINPGNSGGPLLNDLGELIGITTMKLSGEGVEGIGFCIPSNAVFEMLNIKY